MHIQTLEVENTEDECQRVFSFLDNHIKKNHLPDEIHNDLKLILEEAFINIVSYGFESSKKTMIALELKTTNQSIQLKLIDEGKAFNPLTSNNSMDKTNDLSEGGMGIHLIKSLSDEQDYQRSDKENILTLTKYLK